MTRFGFGDKTGESSKGGLTQYENGHVEVSGKALKYAIEEYPGQPPKEAVGRLLAGVTDQGSDQPNIDWDSVSDRVQAVDGVGEKVAESVVSELREMLGDAEEIEA